jgi:hypothetical protein
MIKIREYNKADDLTVKSIFAVGIRSQYNTNIIENLKW